MTRELDVREIYKLLEADKKYLLPHVNSKNVDELITIAMEKQNKQLESRLKMWK